MTRRSGKQKNFWSKTSTIVIVFIVVWPIGMYLLYKYRNFKGKKLLAFILIPILSLISIGILFNDEEISQLDELVSIQYQTKTVQDKEIEFGKKVVKQKGKNGQKNIKYEIIKKDGKIVSKKKLEEKIIKKPITEIVHIGMKKQEVKEEKDSNKTENSIDKHIVNNSTNGVNNTPHQNSNNFTSNESPASVPTQPAPIPPPAPQPAPAPVPPPVTNMPLKAICNDGSVSYQNNPSRDDYRGMCSGHGGIAQKLGRVP